MPVELGKRVEAASVSLAKIARDSPIDLGDVCAQVDIACDRSGSAVAQWPVVYQEAVERALALAMTGLSTTPPPCTCRLSPQHAHQSSTRRRP